MKYATDEVIAETTSEVTRFAQPSNMTPYQNADELVTKTLRCGDVYEEYGVKNIFIESLDSSIRHNM